MYIKPKAFSLRIAPTLFAQYEADAKKNFRSINQHLEAVLTHAMDTKKEAEIALHKHCYGDGILNGKA